MKLATNQIIRKFQCSACTKTFARKGDLVRHELLHTGYKPHKCFDCGKAFSQFSGLKTHQNVHSKVKPFACGFGNCAAAFGDPSSCARHRKETHLRVGAFRCPHPCCKSSIKRRSAFAKHLRKHNIDPDIVDIDSLAPPLLSAPRVTRKLSISRNQAPSQIQEPKTPILRSQNNDIFTGFGHLPSLSAWLESPFEEKANINTQPSIHDRSQPQQLPLVHSNDHLQWAFSGSSSSSPVSSDDNTRTPSSDFQVPVQYIKPNFHPYSQPLWQVEETFSRVKHRDDSGFESYFQYAPGEQKRLWIAPVESQIF